MDRLPDRLLINTYDNAITRMQYVMYNGEYKAPIIHYEPIDNYIAVEFGFHDADLNNFILPFISTDVLSRYVDEELYIYQLADVLNWDIISTKELPGWLFVTFKNKINWPVFICNRKPKEVLYLMYVQDKLLEHRELFLDHYVKLSYYTEEFVSAFPWLVNWKWFVKHMKISDYILKKYWKHFNINYICKYQSLSDEIIDEKRLQLNWNILCSKPLSEYTIRKNIDFVNFSVLCKWQTVTEEFILEYQDRIKYDPLVITALCRYQQLSESFILANKWVDMSVISEYQNLSLAFIKANILILNMESLSKNRRYNKCNTIQIFKVYDRWYIIDEPIVHCNSKITFCTIEHCEL